MKLGEWQEKMIMMRAAEKLEAKAKASGRSLKEMATDERAINGAIDEVLADLRASPGANPVAR